MGNEYNLNNVKEISVTEDFLTLDKTIIKCQNEESLQDCKTRKYINTMVDQCKCLPFAIRNDNEVSLHHTVMRKSLLYFSTRSFRHVYDCFTCPTIISSNLPY